MSDSDDTDAGWRGIGPRGSRSPADDDQPPVGSYYNTRYGRRYGQDDGGPGYSSRDEWGRDDRDGWDVPGPDDRTRHHQAYGDGYEDVTRYHAPPPPRTGRGGPPGPSGPGGPGSMYEDGRAPGHRRGARPRRRLRTALIVLGFTTLIGLVGGAAAFAIGYAMTDIPDPNKLVTSNTSIVYWNDGKTELGRFAAQNRVSINLDKVPKHVQDAIVAAENRTFWTDKGVDPIGTVRAAINTLQGEGKQGASTITQQYVKNFYLTPDQTLKRKVDELFITLKVQRELSKEEILQHYLNTSHFGRGCWGVQTAAQEYFGKDAEDLTIEEGAVLASLLKAPANYDPAQNDGDTSRLDQRFRWTLQSMEEMGSIPVGTAETAKLPKVLPPKSEDKYGGPKGHLLIEVRKQLNELGYTDEEIDTGGLRVTATFDRKAQRAINRAFRGEFPKEKAKGLYAGGVAIRPGTGEVVAMYGGKDYVERQWNDATQSQIQPGSTFKAFGLVAALESGISLESRFFGNTPYWVGGRKTDEDRVANLGDRDWGKNVDLIEATKHSINTVFVDMTENELGADKVLDAAVRAGIPEDAQGMDKVVPKAVLGQASVRPIDLANAYATLAAGGYRSDAHIISEVTSGDRDAYVADPNSERVFAADVTAEVTYALQQVVTKDGSGSEAMALGRPSAGKTGTHEDETSWYAGYTPQMAMAVAFYKDADGDGTKDSLKGAGGLESFYGGEYPARIWTAFMRAALDGEEVREFSPRPQSLGTPVNPTPTKAVASPSPTPTPTTTASPTKTPPGQVPPTVSASPTVEPTKTNGPPGPTESPSPTPTVEPTQTVWPTRTPGRPSPKPDLDRPFTIFGWW